MSEIAEDTKVNLKLVGTAIAAVVGIICYDFGWKDAMNVRMTKEEMVSEFHGKSIAKLELEQDRMNYKKKPVTFVRDTTFDYVTFK